MKASVQRPPTAARRAKSRRIPGNRLMKKALARARSTSLVTSISDEEYDKTEVIRQYQSNAVPSLMESSGSSAASTSVGPDNNGGAYVSLSVLSKMEAAATSLPRRSQRDNQNQKENGTLESPTNQRQLPSPQRSQKPRSLQSPAKLFKTEASKNSRNGSSSNSSNSSNSNSSSSSSSDSSSAYLSYTDQDAHAAIEAAAQAVFARQKSQVSNSSASSMPPPPPPVPVGRGESFFEQSLSPRVSNRGQVGKVATSPVSWAEIDFEEVHAKENSPARDFLPQQYRSPRHGPEKPNKNESTLSFPPVPTIAVVRKRSAENANKTSLHCRGDAEHKRGTKHGSVSSPKSFPRVGVSDLSMGTAGAHRMSLHPSHKDRGASVPPVWTFHPGKQPLAQSSTDQPPSLLLLPASYHQRRFSEEDSDEDEDDNFKQARGTGQHGEEEVAYVPHNSARVQMDGNVVDSSTDNESIDGGKTSSAIATAHQSVRLKIARKKTKNGEPQEPSFEVKTAVKEKSESVEAALADDLTEASESVIAASYSTRTKVKGLTISTEAAKLSGGPESSTSKTEIKGITISVETLQECEKSRISRPLSMPPTSREARDMEQPSTNDALGEISQDIEEDFGGTAHFLSEEDIDIEDEKGVTKKRRRLQFCLSALVILSLLGAILGVVVSMSNNNSGQSTLSSNDSDPGNTFPTDGEETTGRFPPNPTASPSNNSVDLFPTPSPTFRPTLRPTRNPTQRPTKQPRTKAPTTNPSTAPGFPTQRPSPSPTSSPTLSPTSRPTASPSIRTLSPTSAPTTSSPTRTPSVAPTPRTLLPEEIRDSVVEFLVPFSGQSALTDETSFPYRATDLLLEVLALDSDAVRAISVTSPSSARIVENEQALRVLHTYIVILMYVSTGGDGWRNTINFLTSDNICEWNGSAGGVFCDSQTGSVKSILLYGNNLQGTLIPELGFLDTLEWLSITNNPGIAGRIPSELGNLKRLSQLILVDNSITGSIPPQIFSDLPKLEQLSLWGNLLTGSIPQDFSISDGDPSSGASTLKEIDLDSNVGLTGGLAELLNAVPSSLEKFLCGGCNFAGPAAGSTDLESVDWARLKSLQTLSLGDTGISGRIPRDLGKVVTLKVLELDRNKLTGQIPNNLAKELVLLEKLVLNSNSLTGDLPAMSSPVLRILDVEENTLQGNLGKILADSVSAQIMQNLLLGYNDLTGSLTSEIGNFQSLNYLGIAYNSITGVIPAQLGDLTSLFTLELQGNKFEGSIPDTLALLPSLFNLGLHDNAQLAGSDLNDVFCEAGGVASVAGDLTVDCGQPELVSCRCCQCYSIDAGDFI